MGKDKDYCYNEDFTCYKYSEAVLTQYKQLFFNYIVSTTQISNAYNLLSNETQLMDIVEYNSSFVLDRFNIEYSTKHDLFYTELQYEDFSNLELEDITEAENILLLFIVNTIEKFHHPVHVKQKIKKIDIIEDVEVHFLKYVYIIDTFIITDSMNNNLKESIQYYSSEINIGRILLHTNGKSLVLDYIEGTSGPEHIELIEKNREKLESLTTPLEMRLINYILGIK